MTDILIAICAGILTLIWAMWIVSGADGKRKPARRVPGISRDDCA